MAKQHTREEEKILVRKVDISNPFHASDLPLIVYLYRMAYHTYKRRWTKRIFKRPARIIFDFVYHVLHLRGEGNITLQMQSETRSLRFNGRNGQFGGIYRYTEHHIIEAPLVGLMQVLLKDDDVFFDVGANWGCLSLHAATFPKFHGDIHAFEPLPNTFSDLTSMVQQSKLNGRIRCHRLALSDRSGTGTMILPDTAQSGWAQLSNAGSGIQVSLSRLDDIDVPDPNFVKIDAEGHELQVLIGAEAMLRRSKAFIIFESWLDPRNPGKTAGPWQFLSSLGYDFYCPAWQIENERSLITITNMPTGKTGEFPLVLVPCKLEHRMFGPEQWNYLACHVDQREKLIRAFSQTS